MWHERLPSNIQDSTRMGASGLHLLLYLPGADNIDALVHADTR